MTSPAPIPPGLRAPLAVAAAVAVLLLALPAIVPAPAGGPPAPRRGPGEVPGSAGETDVEVVAAAAGPTGLARWDVFTNFGHYMPRTHCVLDAQGRPDWPWILGLVVLSLGIVAAYVRIYTFWMHTHRTQATEDRDPKMFELANIFFWCAVCGYGMSVVMFAWPAYRLLAIFLLLLNMWSWRFVLTDLDAFRTSLRARALERELNRELADRNAELERQVAERTSELEAARAKAESANRAKSDFLASMSHEIRTPMTAILGFAELLHDRDAEDAVRAEELADTIRRNAHHLLAVINDVLDVSKIEAGRMTVDPVETDFVRVVEDVEGICGGHAAAKGLDFRVAWTTSVPARITTDPVRLRQILLNLAGNAIKFTDAGSVHLRITDDPRARRLRFDVVDTGIGLDAEQRARLRRFEPFTQADASMSRRFGGTGLGLQISRAFAVMLGGDIEIESAPGSGSTFSVTVSAARPDDAPRLVPDRAGRIRATETATAPSGTTAPDALAGVRVLLAEDGPDNRRLIIHHLERAGAEVETVEDGRLAFDALAGPAADRLHVDVVLLDMQMPELDGYEVVRRWRAAGIETPVIAITAHAMTGDRERCLAAGCTDYLTKPIDRRALVDRCGEHARDARPR